MMVHSALVSLSSLLITPTSLLTAVLLALSSLLWWLSTRRPPGIPPGPGPALPLLGHLHLLERDPRHKLWEWRRRYGDVFSLYLGSQLVVVVCGYNAIKEAFVKSAAAFSERPKTFFLENVIKEGVVFSSGAMWKEQRKVSLEILRKMGLGKNVLDERIQEEVTHYIKALHSYQGRPADLAATTRTSICNNISSLIFGKRFEYDDPTFTSYLAAMEDNFQIVQSCSVLSNFPWLRFLPGDVLKLKRFVANQNMVRENVVRPQLNAHLRNHAEADESDFIHAYIRQIHKHAQGDQPETTVNADNLLSVIDDLFNAGTETTTTTIRWAVVFLTRNPHVQDKCFAEIQRVVGTGRAPSTRDKPELTYVEATIMEVLRAANIGPLSIPHGSADYEAVFQGYTIPRHSVVLQFLESVLHDPDIWDEPLIFRPERFIDADGKLTKPDEFIPFGIGRRACLGESLARMELFLYVSTMIQHFRFLPLEDGQLPSLEYKTGLTYSPVPYLVRAVPRH